MLSANKQQSYIGIPKKYLGIAAAILMQLLLTKEADSQVMISPNAQVHIQKNAIVYTPGVSVDSGAIHGKGTINNRGNWDANTPVMNDTDSITVHFDGNITQNIGGSVGSRMHKMVVNNPQGITTTPNLTPDMKVDTVTMQNGNRDLDSNNVNIDRLAGESNQSHITGPGTMTAQDTINNQTKNIGNLGARITSTEDLGNVTVVRGHASPESGVLADVRYDITPENAQTQPVDVSIVRTVTDRETGVPVDPSFYRVFQENNSVFTEIPSTSDTVNNEIVVVSLADMTKRLSYGYLGVPLSVSLVSFSANCEGGLTVLNRKTASETDSNHFEIQKSTDGLYWYAIGTVPAAGNSTQTIDYTFEDSTANDAIVYYRLVEYDNNNNAESHPIISSNCFYPNIRNLVAFPNPTAGGVILQIQSNIHKDLPLSVVSMDGKLLYEQEIYTIHGTVQHYIDLSNFPDGVYALRVGDKTIRVVVTK